MIRSFPIPLEKVRGWYSFCKILPVVFPPPKSPSPSSEEISSSNHLFSGDIPGKSKKQFIHCFFFRKDYWFLVRVVYNQHFQATIILMVFDFLGYIYIHILGFFRLGYQKFQRQRHGVWRHHPPKLQSIVPILLNWSSHHGWWVSSSKMIGVVESWGVSRFGGIPGGVDGKMWTCFHTKKMWSENVWMCDENVHFHQQKDKVTWIQVTRSWLICRGVCFLLRDYSRVAHTQSIINRKFMSIDIISVFITICIHILYLCLSCILILYTLAGLPPPSTKLGFFWLILKKTVWVWVAMGLSCFDDTLLVPAWHKQEDFW